jgi:LPXTG-site transpeptidase (sortase) family protein
MQIKHNTLHTILSALVITLMVFASLPISSVHALPGSSSIVLNGDFEAGNSGFTSSYTYAADGAGTSELYPERFYSVVKNPKNVHDGFNSKGDHTSGSGLMFVANGGPDTSDIVWQGTITQDLVVGQKYDFSAWVMNTAAAGINANLTFKAGAATIGSYDVTSKDWMRLFGTFTADSARPALVLRNNVASKEGGNDFAIDDIDIFVAGTTCPPSAGTAPSSITIGDPFDPEWSEPSPLGETVSAKVTVFGGEALPKPTGTISVSVDGDPAWAASKPLDSDGQATVTYDTALPSITPGPITFRVVYSGDPIYKVNVGTVVKNLVACERSTITSVSPASGLVGGGTSVIVTGSGAQFAGTSTTLSFGGSLSSCQYASPTTKSCITPAHAAGQVDVVGSTCGMTATLSNGFTYTAPSSGPTSVPSSIVPNTGFAMGMVTPLEKQPASKAYAASELVLRIPSINVTTNIFGVPEVNGNYDVTWLGKSVGYLGGSAFPTWKGNSVITGHVWDANNIPGVFVNLRKLQIGDLVEVVAWGQVYTYKVIESRIILPNQASLLFKHSNDGSTITLMTCEFFNPLTSNYSFRRMVRTKFVSISPVK